MKKLVLLTGATGFVGRPVLRHLQAKNVDIRLVVRKSSTPPVKVSANIEEIITTEDIFAETKDWWSNVCRDVDTIVHAAWYTEPGKYLLSPVNLDCLIGTLQMAKGAVESGVRRFVGIGSCSEYETSDHRLATDAPLRPTTPYASAKAAAFLALSSMLPERGMDFAWCRLFYLHGEGEHKNRLVPQLHASLSKGRMMELTSGTQVRDFMDVREAGRQIAEVALGDVVGAFNICTGRGVTVRELAESIADGYGRRDLLSFGTRLDNSFDPSYVVGIPSLQ